MTDEDTSEKNRKWQPCPECGSSDIRKEKWKLALHADVVCQNCEHREDARNMTTGTEVRSERKSFREALSERQSDNSGIDLTPKQKLWQNSGMLLVVLGVLLSLTLVGAIIGIPMIIAGMIISSKGGPDIDEIEFSCPECDAELQHDTKVCPECGEEGLRLSKSKSMKE